MQFHKFGFYIVVQFGVAKSIHLNEFVYVVVKRNVSSFIGFSNPNLAWCNAEQTLNMLFVNRYSKKIDFIFELKLDHHAKKIKFSNLLNFKFYPT